MESLLVVLLLLLVVVVVCLSHQLWGQQLLLLQPSWAW
jgi:hypothetical protein